jgi:hypothetical protein
MIEEEHKIAFGKERTIISGIFILCIDIYLFFSGAFSEIA